jgi:hypothetical protein
MWRQGLASLHQPLRNRAVGEGEISFRRESAGSLVIEIRFLSSILFKWCVIVAGSLFNSLAMSEGPAMQNGRRGKGIKFIFKPLVEVFCL